MTASGWWRWRGDLLVLSVRAQPRASRDEVTGEHGGELRVRVAAPPVDDAANRRIVETMARAFGVPRSAVRVAAGAKSRGKTVEVRSPRRYPEWLPTQARRGQGTKPR